LLWDQGKPRKTLIELAGRRTFRMQPTSSQQSGIKSANPNISPFSLLLYFSFLVFFFFHNKLFCFYNYLYVHMIWISTKQYNPLMEGIKAYVNKHAYKHTYICICFSSIGNRMFYEVCCLSNNKDCFTANSFHFSFVSLV
jgi:hypothetical protein